MRTGYSILLRSRAEVFALLDADPGDRLADALDSAVGGERIDEVDEKRADLRASDGTIKYIVEVKGRQEDETYLKGLQERGTAEHSTPISYRNNVASVVRGAAMQLESTAEELGRTMHAHPTVSEAVMEAAEGVHDLAVHI